MSDQANIPEVSETPSAEQDGPLTTEELLFISAYRTRNYRAFVQALVTKDDGKTPPLDLLDAALKANDKATFQAIAEAVADRLPGKDLPQLRDDPQMAHQYGAFLFGKLALDGAFSDKELYDGSLVTRIIDSLTDGIDDAVSGWTRGGFQSLQTMYNFAVDGDRRPITAKRGEAE